MIHLLDTILARHMEGEKANLIFLCLDFFWISITELIPYIYIWILESSFLKYLAQFQ